MGYKVIINSTKIKFSACHFLKEPLKCSRLHGHNYYVSVELEAELDENYFVEDFIKLKSKVKEIVKPLDHFILIPEESPDFNFNSDQNSLEVLTSNKRYVFPISEVVFLPIPATTSELLAKYIYDKIKEHYKNKKVIVKLEESKDTLAVYQD
ncbi:MAG: 6-pyruvoyl tetrahydropterin synthase family protein [Candidatus Heimdallarchaeota archaeon]